MLQFLCSVLDFYKQILINLNLYFNFLRYITNISNLALLLLLLSYLFVIINNLIVTATGMIAINNTLDCLDIRMDSIS